MDTSSLVQSALDGGLFQSEAWARFEKEDGARGLSLAHEDFLASGFIRRLPFVGEYLSIPRGPLVGENTLHFESALDQLLTLARQEKLSFIRIEPQSERELLLFQKALGNTCVQAPHDSQPRESLVVSLEGTEEEWVAQMKSKTRYNIRLAEKHGVTVRFSRSEKDLEAFLTLVQSTSHRKAIHPHPERRYRNFLKAFAEEACTLALAEFEGKMLAASLLVFFGNRAYYLHGGSSAESRELMAPFLLHFASMREAKRRGMTRYDMGGVRLQSKKDATDTNWDGITRFKQGFAPRETPLLFPGTYDIVLNMERYFLYKTLRRLRTLLR